MITILNIGKLGLVSWLAQTVGANINHLGLNWMTSALILLIVYDMHITYLLAQQHTSQQCLMPFF